MLLIQRAKGSYRPQSLPDGTGDSINLIGDSRDTYGILQLLFLLIMEYIHKQLCICLYLYNPYMHSILVHPGSGQASHFSLGGIEADFCGDCRGRSRWADGATLRVVQWSSNTYYPMGLCQMCEIILHTVLIVLNYAYIVYASF